MPTTRKAPIDASVFSLRIPPSPSFSESSLSESPFDPPFFDPLSSPFHPSLSSPFLPSLSPFDPVYCSAIDPRLFAPPIDYSIFPYPSPSDPPPRSPHSPLDSSSDYDDSPTLAHARLPHRAPYTPRRLGARKTLIPAETMASYIDGPDPADSKFLCLYHNCGKRFGRKYNIQSHIQTHLSDRPYCCPVCRAGFVRQHDLRRHSRIHAGEKPYKCACNKGFSRMDALTRHRQRRMTEACFL